MFKVYLIIRKKVAKDLLLMIILLKPILRKEIPEFRQQLATLKYMGIPTMIVTKIIRMEHLMRQAHSIKFIRFFHQIAIR